VQLNWREFKGSTDLLKLEVVLIRNFSDTWTIPSKEVRHRTASFVTVASANSDGSSAGDNDEWTFQIGQSDGDVVTIVDDNGDLVLKAPLFAGEDSIFERVSYQATVLAHGD
jgi:hypothetical protein